MLRVFIGYDPRQPIAYNVAQYSVIRNASKPISVTPLVLDQLPISRKGLTEFTFSRFLVPYLCGFEGRAVFMDPDMIVTGDIVELFEMELTHRVHMVQDQPRFEWPSMMVFDNAKCTHLTPEFVSTQNMFELNWATPGDIPKEWNHCIGYEDCENAKLHHYTKGIPVWPETEKLEPDLWHNYWRQSNGTVSYQELMGGSVHAANQ